MTNNTARRVLMVGFLFTWGSFLAAQEAEKTPTTATADEISGIRNFSRHSESIAFGGAPTDEALASLKEAGFKTILDLRTPEEGTEAERQKVESLGMTYHNIPITPSSITDEKVEEFSRIVDGAGNKPLLIHCASSNRVGGLWFIHRALADDVPEAESLDEAKKAGLRSPALEQVVRDYVEKKRSPPPK